MTAEKTTALKKWNDESVSALLELVGTSRPVASDIVSKAAEALGVSERSVAAKLRNLDIEVASMAKPAVASFSDEETEALSAFVQNNSGVFTYKEIAEEFKDGAFTYKQVQGKILSLELTGHVKATEKEVASRSYTDEQESQFISLAKAGKFLEEIAEQLGKTLQSVRGKALSLFRSGEIEAIPAQKESYAKDDVDALAGVSPEALATMTVADVMELTGKTERGTKTTLTRRGINVADYKGADKKAKAEAK